MKILGIGLSKTGTSSLARALDLLGFPCIHSPEVCRIEAARAATDISVAARFRELDVLYPGSRFILTVRDRDSWLESCRRHWQRHPYPLSDQPVAARFEYAWCRVKMFGTTEFEPENHWRRYRQHLAEVHSHFAERPQDLLTLNVVAGEGWEKLCPFLGVPVPRVPFPWLNRG